MKQIEELRNILSKLSVNELMEITNEATAEIRHRNNARMQNNIRILDAEIRNLLDGVGDGFISGDYYAKDRYYSSIRGVKNIRIYKSEELGEKEAELLVKILSPKGKLLPKEITVRNIKYRIEFVPSKKYTMEIDY